MEFLNPLFTGRGKQLVSITQTSTPLNTDEEINEDEEALPSVFASNVELCQDLTEQDEKTQKPMLNSQILRENDSTVPVEQLQNVQVANTVDFNSSTSSSSHVTHPAHRFSNRLDSQPSKQTILSCHVLPAHQNAPRNNQFARDDRRQSASPMTSNEFIETSQTDNNPQSRNGDQQFVRDSYVVDCLTTV